MEQRYIREVQPPTKQATERRRLSGGTDVNAPAAAPTGETIGQTEDGAVGTTLRAELGASQNQTSSDPTKHSPIAPFVSKTYAIVNGESDEVVSWWQTGGEDTFVIKRVEVFQEQVLPRFFSHNNYSSFVRQLNNHGEPATYVQGSTAVGIPVVHVLPARVGFDPLPFYLGRGRKCYHHINSSLLFFRLHGSLCRKSAFVLESMDIFRPQSRSCVSRMAYKGT